MTKAKCSCGEAGIVKVPAEISATGWLCTACVTVLVNSPEAIALNTAQGELDELIDLGGKPS
jgi:hypothetical protein